MREEVGGHHGDHEAGALDGLTQPSDGVALLGRRGVEGEDVVVVEGDPVGPQLGQPGHRHHRVQRFAHSGAEDIDTLPAHRPQPEREEVFAARLNHEFLPQMPLGNCHVGQREQ